LFFQCDTVTNLSDLLADQDDEDVKNLLISIQSDSLTEQQQSRKILQSFIQIIIDYLF
jgi:hypothetical protein